MGVVAPGSQHGRQGRRQDRRRRRSLLPGAGPGRWRPRRVHGGRRPPGALTCPCSGGPAASRSATATTWRRRRRRRRRLPSLRGSWRAHRDGLAAAPAPHCRAAGGGGRGGAGLPGPRSSGQADRDFLVAAAAGPQARGASRAAPAPRAGAGAHGRPRGRRAAGPRPPAPSRAPRTTFRRAQRGWGPRAARAPLGPFPAPPPARRMGKTPFPDHSPPRADRSGRTACTRCATPRLWRPRAPRLLPGTASPGRAAGRGRRGGGARTPATVWGMATVRVLRRVVLPRRGPTCVQTHSSELCRWRRVPTYLGPPSVLQAGWEDSRPQDRRERGRRLAAVRALGSFLPTRAATRTGGGGVGMAAFSAAFLAGGPRGQEGRLAPGGGTEAEGEGGPPPWWEALGMSGGPRGWRWGVEGGGAGHACQEVAMGEGQAAGLAVAGSPSPPLREPRAQRLEPAPRPGPAQAPPQPRPGPAPRPPARRCLAAPGCDLTLSLAQPPGP